MKNEIAELLSFCSRVDFGTVSLSPEEEAFRRDLNRELVLLCESLPKSMRTEAALFLVSYLHAYFSEGLNFVNYFYPPAWSIVFWLYQSCPDKARLAPKYVKDAKTGHTMAMFLHAFDDHLNDGQLPVTHLALLIRSQAWMIMNQAYEKLARGVDKGASVVSGLMDDYYSSIGRSDSTDSLDSYCALFRKQMATWLIVPVLLSRRINSEWGFTRSVQSVYTSFGIAWRLLDDLQDLEKDMRKGVHSSIYTCLDEDWRVLWDKASKEMMGQDQGFVQDILNGVIENKVIDKIIVRTCRELDSAASIADSCSMPGFGRELRSLLKPLINGFRRHDDKHC